MHDVCFPITIMHGDALNNWTFFDMQWTACRLCTCWLLEGEQNLLKQPQGLAMFHRSAAINHRCISLNDDVGMAGRRASPETNALASFSQL